MHNLKKIILLLFSIVFTVAAIAQSNVADTTAAQTGMRSNGKIFVVMVIVTTILAGILFYVIRLDKRIGKLEKEGL